jgi:ferredoxin-NADP reductase
VSLSHSLSLEVVLVQARLEAQGIVSYELRAPGNEALPAFTAGAHIDLYLPDGMTRSYSLANDPGERQRYVIAVQLAEQGRGGSAWLHSTSRIGERLRISLPRNDFELVQDPGLAVFICGGIGITPALSMIHLRVRQGLPWRLLYAVRSHERCAFVEELLDLEQRQGLGQVQFFRSDDDERLDMQRVITTTPADAHLYCCGPQRMINEFIAATSSRPPTLVHYERFAAASEAATGGGFEVVLQRSGTRISVEAGKSILDALLENGVDVQYACSNGVCGTCRTGVLEGVPDHRDDYLTDDEKRGNTAVMVCCSGALSPRLVLDL